MVKKSVAERGVVRYVAAPPEHTANDSLIEFVTVADSKSEVDTDCFSDSEGVPMLFVSDALDSNVALPFEPERVVLFVNVMVKVSDCSGRVSVKFTDADGVRVSVSISDSVAVMLADRSGMVKVMLEDSEFVTVFSVYVSR